MIDLAAVLKRAFPDAVAKVLPWSTAESAVMRGAFLGEGDGDLRLMSRPTGIFAASFEPYNGDPALTGEGETPEIAIDQLFDLIVSNHQQRANVWQAARLKAWDRMVRE